MAYNAGTRQVKVTTNCGDATLIDRIELNASTNRWSDTQPKMVSEQIGAWGNVDNEGWCMSNEAADNFGWNGWDDECPATRCFRGGIPHLAFLNNCPDYPPEGSLGGLLCGTAGE